MSGQWLMAIVLFLIIFLIIFLVKLDERKHRKIMDELRKKKTEKILSGFEFSDDDKVQEKIDQAAAESVAANKLKEKLSKFKGKFIPRIFRDKRE